MTTTFVDRRHSAAFEIDPEVESERLRRRADVRAEAARLQLEKDKIPALQTVLDESLARVEAATDAHSAACKPLQEELTRLETEAVARVRRREPPDSAADGRRVEILRQIANENATLEAVVEAEKTFRAPTEREVWRLRNKILDPAAVLNRLGQGSLASPKLLSELHVAQQRARWAGARLEAAARPLKIRKHNLAEIQAGRMSGDPSVQKMHISQWEAEAAAAQFELSAARAESEAIYRKLLDE